MATADEYAAWIVQNSDKKGTPEFDTVAKAYKLAKIDPKPKAEPGMGAADVPWYENMAAGVGKAGYDLARGVGQLTGLTSQESVDAAKKMDAPLMKTGAGIAGNVVGNVAAALPTAMIPGVNTVAGAGAVGGLLGLTQPVATGESRAANTLLGAAGGAGGQMLANGIGRAIRPVQSSLDEPLAGLAAKAQGQYGIPLNAAQQTGSRPLKIIDSVLDNLPLTADKQVAAKTVQAKAFNKAVLNTVGESADQATPDVLNAARTRIGGQFDALSGRNSVALGDDFLNSLAAVEGTTNAFTKPGVRDAIDKALNLAAEGNISGQTYQKVRSTLGKQSSDAFSSGNSELGQALKSIKGALDDAATGSISAADKEAWKTARQQWQALKVVAKAAAPTSADAVSGNVSPAKLAQALQSTDKQGFTFGTRGDELSDLARIGQAFLKNGIPDSGTAQRSFYQNFIENPFAAAWHGTTGGLSKPMQSLLNSPAGQVYLSRGLLAPNPQVDAFGRAARQGAGLLGAGLPLSLNAQQQ